MTRLMRVKVKRFLQELIMAKEEEEVTSEVLQQVLEGKEMSLKLFLLVTINIYHDSLQ